MRNLVTENTGISAASARGTGRRPLLALQESPGMRRPCLKLAQGYDWERICDLWKRSMRRSRSEGKMQIGREEFCETRTTQFRGG